MHNPLIYIEKKCYEFHDNNNNSNNNEEVVSVLVK